MTAPAEGQPPEIGDVADLPDAPPPETEGGEIGDEELDSVFDEFWDGEGPREEVVVDAYRWTPNEKNPVYVTRFPASEFSLSELKKRAGGGRFQLRFRAGSQGKSRSKTVVIEGEPRVVKEGAEEEDQRSMMQVVLDTQAGMLDTLNELRNPALNRQANDSGADPITLALSIIGAFQQVMQPYQAALLDQEKSGGTDFADMMEVFFKGVEFASDRPPQGGGDYASVISELGLPLLRQLKEAGSMERATALRPNPGPPGPTPKTTTPPPPGRPPWDILLTPSLPDLQQWAAAGKDPAICGPFVADQLPAEIEHILLEQLSRGREFMVEFFTLHPEARAFEEWYASFFGHIADFFEVIPSGEEGEEPSEEELEEQERWEEEEEEADGDKPQGAE